MIENNDDVRETLRGQLALLAEESEKNKDNTEVLTALSDAMVKIAVILFS